MESLHLKSETKIGNSPGSLSRSLLFAPLPPRQFFSLASPLKYQLAPLSGAGNISNKFIDLHFPQGNTGISEIKSWRVELFLYRMICNQPSSWGVSKLQPPSLLSSQALPLQCGYYSFATVGVWMRLGGHALKLFPGALRASSSKGNIGKTVTLTGCAKRLQKHSEAGPEMGK